jgi:hypothetical protein
MYHDFAAQIVIVILAAEVKSRRQQQAEILIQRRVLIKSLNLFL